MTDHDPMACFRSPFACFFGICHSKWVLILNVFLHFTQIRHCHCSMVKSTCAASKPLLRSCLTHARMFSSARATSREPRLKPLVDEEGCESGLPRDSHRARVELMVAVS